MAKHPLNPEVGHWWYDPETGRNFHVRALTDDGWVRYTRIGDDSEDGVQYTRPTLDFVKYYRKMSV